MRAETILFIQENLGKRQLTNLDAKRSVDDQRVSYDIALIQEPEWNRKDGITEFCKERTIVKASEPNEEVIRPRAMIYFSEKLKEHVLMINELCDENCAVALLEHTEPNGKVVKTLLVSIYFDGSRNIIEDLKKVEKAVMYAESKGYRIIIGGDANAAHTEWASMTFSGLLS